MKPSVITPGSVFVVALMFLALGAAAGIQWNEEIKHREAMRKATGQSDCVSHVFARAGR